ncbi:MAG: hypothetical protein KGO96_07390 [Elusimicrobia bacterium]|nr:hypothetical protein [Elusimicrobiota bacterium]
MFSLKLGRAKDELEILERKLAFSKQVIKCGDILSKERAESKLLDLMGQIEDKKVEVEFLEGKFLKSMLYSALGFSLLVLIVFIWANLLY